MPLSLVFFTKLTDVPLALLGVLISVGNLITLPIPVWAGSLADRFGALPLVIGAQLLQAVGYFGYGWVHGPVGIFVTVTLTAIGVRFFWSAIFTAIADYTDTNPAARSKDTWYAWANMTRTAGLGIGGLITGAAIAGGSAAGYRATAFIAAGCFAAAALIIGLFVRVPRLVHEHPATGPRGYGVLLRDRPFLGLIGVNTVYALTSMMLGLALPTVVLTGLHDPAWLSSGLLVGNTVLISLLAAPVVRRLAAYRRTRTVMVAAGLWASWSLLFATLSPGHLLWTVVLMAAATLMFTMAETLHAPISAALAASAAPAAIRGRYLATFQYSFAIAGIIAPTFFTTLFEVHRSVPWLALAVINVASIGAMFLLERALPAAALREQQQPKAAPEESVA